VCVCVCVWRFSIQRRGRVVVVAGNFWWRPMGGRESVFPFGSSLWGESVGRMRLFSRAGWLA
jgi:hypothetical protein